MMHKFNDGFSQLNIQTNNNIIDDVFSNTLYYPYASYKYLCESAEEFDFNYSIFKTNETINSIFLGLNNFLIQIYMILKEKRGVIEIDDIETFCEHKIQYNDKGKGKVIK